MLSAVREYLDSLPVWAKCAIVGLVPTTLFAARCVMKRPRKSPIKTDWKQGVVYLYQFPRLSTIPNLSPFCMKLETWLRMADITYENVETMTLRSKEGTLPFIEMNGKEYPDSALIIRDLTRILGKDGMEANFSDEDKGASRAFEKMLEHSTSVSYAYVRYTEKLDEMFNQILTMKKFSTIYTRLMLFIMKITARSQIKKNFVIHGIAKHPRDEILNIGFDDLRAFSLYLGKKKYLMGDTATKVDACAFSILGQIIYLPLETPHLEFMKTSCPNLIEYCNRIKERYWPDWEDTCGKQMINTEWKKYL